MCVHGLINLDVFFFTICNVKVFKLFTWQLSEFIYSALYLHVKNVKNRRILKGRYIPQVF